MEHQNGWVKTKIENGVGWITFFHPKSNSLPRKILSELAQKIETLGNDETIKVIILKSAGEKVFCAGASFEELSNIKNAQEGELFFSGFAKVLNAARKCPVLLIGRIQGKAVGGGVGLVSICDYAFAHESASVKLSEISLGIGPFVIEPAVSRKIGVSAFSQLAVNAGKWQESAWAKEKGLFQEVFSQESQMDAAILELAQTLSNNHRPALTHLKKVLWQHTDGWEELLGERAKISGQLVLSEFSQGMLRRIAEKEAKGR
jgi:methylglutaconyl-CoA hydratase